MTAVPARLLNESFLSKTASNEGREKTAEVTGDYIHDRLREAAFVRKILDVVPVTRTDCQVSETHDTLVKIIEIEPRSRAMALTFRGQPEARYFYGERIAVGFYSIFSEKLQKTEQEIMAYTMPITRILEDNSTKDLQDVEDREFLIHVEGACQALQKEANAATDTELNYTKVNDGTVVQYSILKGELAAAAGANDAVVRPLQRPDIARLKTVIDERRLTTDCMLVTEADLNGVLQWTVQDFGDKVQSETTVDGYKHNSLLGVRLVRTIKTDILRRGNIYSFAAPKFFGKMFVLNNPKFWIDKQANMLSFQCWEDIAMVIGNVASCAKLELYSGNANPSAGSQSLIASFTPVAESALGALNNRVSSGLKFPALVVA